MQIRNPYCLDYIKEAPREDLALIVTIPCYNEPDVVPTLQSLYDCEPIDGAVEIILLINNGVHAEQGIIDQNQHTYKTALKWVDDHQADDKRFYIHYFDDLPKKHAGVGLARKIAMDEAASRLVSVGNLDGIIQCYDADSSCDTNLLQAVMDGFKNSKCASLGIYYEHPIEGEDYPCDIYQAIISYELHLRYYDNIQKFIGLPFAFQTIGSSMAARAKDYIAQGGMNRRKAGEDFYFLQKFISLDLHKEIHNTRVIPSPRMSDRVPFGTGKAVKDIIAENNSAYMSYNPAAFEALQILLKDIPVLYASKNILEDSNHWPEALKAYFLKEENIIEIIKENKANTTNYEMFKKRFFKWFNAFRLMKYLHYCRDEGIIEDIPIAEASFIFVNEMLKEEVGETEKEMLLFFRERDRGQNIKV